MSLNPYRYKTQNYGIARLLLDGKTREEIFRELYPKVMSQTEPFIFSNNVNGRRVPIYPVQNQIALLFYRIGLVRADLLKKEPASEEALDNETANARYNYNSKRWRANLYNTVRRENETGYDPTGGITVRPESIVTTDPEIVEDENEQETETENVEELTVEGKLKYLYRRLKEIRAFVQARKVGGRDFDYISTRAFVYGKFAVIAGIEPDDFLVSIGVSWSEDARKEAGIKDAVDYERYAIEDTPLVFGFVLLLAEARIPIYLCGPTGSGKSYLARMLAEYCEAEYGELALSLGVSRTDLFGNWNANGFVPRPLTDIYQNGGIFCFEEMDAADPNILLAVNNAIANNSLFNSSNGEEIVKHPDFIAIATANTWGAGATANYSGREGLDGSTLDRFKYGRVFIDYNSDVEYSLMFEAIDDEDEDDEDEPKPVKKARRK